MNWLSQQRVKDALLFHTLFFAIAIPIALTQSGKSLGLAVTLLALGYNIALPLTGHLRGDREWVQLWLFLLPMSMTLPLADWMLVERMRTLVFPDHGIARIGGAVPVYFMGLWIMLLWQVCWLAGTVRHSYRFAAIVSLLAFLVWEWAARPMHLWHAVGVKQVAGFALYPLIPEMLLGMSALWMWRQCGHAAWPKRVAAGISISVFYAGALSLALLWIK